MPKTTPNTTTRNTSENRRVEFDIVAMSEPNTLLRVLEYFALIGVTPCNVKADANLDGTQIISIIVEGLSQQRAYILAGKINEIFTVNSASYVVKSIEVPSYNPSHSDMRMCA
ncbi:hypothetical protein [Kiloniella sp. EL199]|uniref:hypothetical protein n=1 Tax=Kiloniella sp. EL199 TaxID=2107581 RepID=UPI000EA2D751|nr:hypothetical protein [Kiloniella sp. EL199]